MLRYWASAAVAALLCFAALSFPRQKEDTTPATTDHWVIQQPYGKENPLKRALLAGTANSGEHSSKAFLLVDCHPEGGNISIGVRVPDKELGFDVGSFEGEDGVGKQKKLFRFAVANAPAIFKNVNGAGKDADTFQFNLYPDPKTEFRQIVSPGAAGNAVIVTVQPPDGKGAPLVMHFQLPSNSAPLQTATAPCRAKP